MALSSSSDLVENTQPRSVDLSLTVMMWSPLTMHGYYRCGADRRGVDVAWCMFRSLSRD